ncbi:phage holin [Rossellomorea sp. BNER]|uniref:phage holin n=1 Tax=Rossellomorea sp. BNER TaxID=2962031 RepID=UPI003AF2B044|nr:phage holin [Rossellomorea sp. BNER]
MKNLDKGTVIRTVLLLIALINQTLIMVGMPIIPIEEGQITSLVDGIYLVGSILFTIVTIVMAWFKNNYVTRNGKLQKKALQTQGLIKK